MSRWCVPSREGFARLVDGIGALPGAEVVWRPTINQGLVRFLLQRPDAAPARPPMRAPTRSSRVSPGGEAMFGGVTWKGRRAVPGASVRSLAPRRPTSTAPWWPGARDRSMGPAFPGAPAEAIQRQPDFGWR